MNMFYSGVLDLNWNMLDLNATGMPCMHACSALALRGLKPEDHCHAWLTLGSYRATYNYFIQPVNSQIYWESTPYDKPVPPKVKRAPGRPKKVRR